MKQNRISLVIAIFIMILMIFVITQKNTLEEAIDDVTDVDYKILHIEEQRNKYIVTSITDDDYLKFDVVKHGVLNYKVIHSGVQSDYERVIDTFGAIFIELPREIMDGKLICFGIFDDYSISELEIINSDSGNSVKASIITAGILKYWSANLSEFSTSNIVITGYNSERIKLIETEEVLNWN